MINVFFFYKSKSLLLFKHKPNLYYKSVSLLLILQNRTDFILFFISPPTYQSY